MWKNDELKEIVEKSDLYSRNIVYIKMWIFCEKICIFWWKEEYFFDT